MKTTVLSLVLSCLFCISCSSSDVSVSRHPADAAIVAIDSNISYDTGADAAPIPTCSTATCDDNSVCTVDTCVDGQCLHDKDPYCVPCDTDDDCPTFNGYNGGCMDDGRIHASGFTGKCVEKKCEIKYLVYSCDDNNPCTSDDCSGHTCKHEMVNCDDGNPCTFDTCDIKTGCGHVTDKICVSCKVDADCPNVTDTKCVDNATYYYTGKCAYSQCEWFNKSCDDNNPDTIDACDSKTGKCTNYYPWALKLELTIDPQEELTLTTQIILEWAYKKNGKWADHAEVEEWQSWDKTNTITLWSLPDPILSACTAYFDLDPKENPAPVVFTARQYDKKDPLDLLKVKELGGNKIKATFVIKPFTAEKQEFPLTTQPAPKPPFYSPKVSDLDYYEAVELKEMCKPFMK